MIGEGIVVDTIVDFRVWVTSAFGAKLPYCPVFAVFRVEEFDQRVERIAVSALGISTTRAGGGNDCRQSACLITDCFGKELMYCCQSHSTSPGQPQHALHVDRPQSGEVWTPARN